MRVAIVHDWLYGGGAEKVVEQLHKIYPDAPIYTSYCTDEWRRRLDNKVITGYLNYWPFTSLRKFLALPRQWWFAKLNLSEYDLIISSSGNGEAKFARTTKKNAKHICYCHTPPHFYWRKYDSYLQNPGFGKLDWLARFGLKLLVRPLRRRDYKAAQKVDYFLANSRHIQADIKTYYGRDSVVIHPPINTDAFSKTVPSKNRDCFVYWGRHVPDKRIDLAIKACNELNEQLIVAGQGPVTNYLKSIASHKIDFIGFADEQQILEIASRAKAFIFPSEEDFGISPVEAMAAGVPVVAYGAGGALDYVTPGKTGELFTKQTAESIINTLQKFDYKKYDQKVLRQTAEQFSEENFRQRFGDFLAKSLN